MISRERPEPIDERALVSGTSVRFVQTMVLMLVVTAGMASMTSFESGHVWGCYAAAGLYPTDLTMLDVFHATEPYAAAFESCIDEWGGRSPTWLAFVWPLVLAAATLVWFWALPRWRTWRHRARLTAPDTSLERHLSELRHRSGLRVEPTVVIDTGRANSTNAVVFGSDRRPLIRLDGGLLLLRRRKPAEFEAVVLHELAHVGNRDITSTYLTVAMWRAFILVVALPFAVLQLVSFVGDILSLSAGIQLMFTVRELTLAVVAVLVVHFARSEVLRSREIYADRTAMRAGARLRSFFSEGPGTEPSRVRRSLRAMASLGHPHPSHEDRAEALAHPATLFRIHPALVFTTGITAMLVSAQSSTVLPEPYTNSFLVRLTPQLATAALVATVVGVAQWRAAVWSTIRPADATSGIRSGLWLGSGMVIGELIQLRSTTYGWAPVEPAMLVVPLAIGVLFCWWTTQCSRLWAGLWRGRSTAPVMAAIILGSGIAFAAAILWWSDHGTVWASGFRLDLEGVLDGYRQNPDYADLDDHPWTAPILGIFVPLLVALFDGPLVWVAGAVCWAVPLAAWVLRGDDRAPLWVLRKPAAARTDLPPLRRLLSAAGVGGTIATALAAAAAFWVQRWSPWSLEPRSLELAVFLVAVAAALCLGAAAAATVAVVGRTRFRLVSALVAAHLALALGFAGVLAVMAIDGCIDEAGVVASRCGVEHLGGFTDLLVIFSAAILVVSTATAVAAAAAAGTASLILSRVGSGERKRRLSRAPAFAARLTAAALAASALSFGATASASQLIDASGSPPTTTGCCGVLSPAEAQELSEEERRLLVSAWWVFGGGDRFTAVLDALEAIAPELDAVQAGTEFDREALRAGCLEVDPAVEQAQAFFPIPNPDADHAWQMTLEDFQNAARSCVHAVDQRNSALLDAASSDFLDATQSMESTIRLIEQHGVEPEEVDP